MSGDVVLVHATEIRVGDFCWSGERITNVELDGDGVTVTWEQANTVPADAELYVIREVAS